MRERIVLLMSENISMCVKDVIWRLRIRMDCWCVITVYAPRFERRGERNILGHFKRP